MPEWDSFWRKDSSDVVKKVFLFRSDREAHCREIDKRVELMVLSKRFFPELSELLDCIVEQPLDILATQSALKVHGALDSLRYCHYLSLNPFAAKTLTQVFLRQFKQRVRKYATYQLKT